MRSQKGFTLIELLVVIAIIGVLAAVVVPNVGKYIGAGSVSAANTELSTVQTAVLATMADAKVATMTAGTLSKSGDFTVKTGYTVGAYLSGGYPKLVHSYIIDASGNVSGVSDSEVNWNDTTKQFEAK